MKVEKFLFEIFKLENVRVLSNFHVRLYITYIDWKFEEVNENINFGNLQKEQVKNVKICRVLKFKIDSQREWNVLVNENMNALKLEIDLWARIFECSKKARVNFHTKWNVVHHPLILEFYIYIYYTANEIYAWTIKIIDWGKFKNLEFTSRL